MAFDEHERSGKEALMIFDVHLEEPRKTTKISVCDVAGIWTGKRLHRGQKVISLGNVPGVVCGGRECVFTGRFSS